MTNSDPPRSEPSRPLLTHPRRRSHPVVWVIIAVVIVIVAVALIIRHRDATDSAASGASGSVAGSPGKGRSGKRGANGAPAVMPVGTATVTVADVPVILDGLGTVVPRANVTVQARISGQLMSVRYKEGQLVKAGDVLVEVDPRPYQAAVESAEGNLLRDQALLANARMDLKRYQTLVAEESIAVQTLDTQAALVKQYEGNVKADQGALDSAKVNLLYTKVTAPVTGRVGLRPVDVGNVVTTSETNGVALITEQQPIDVTFTIPQDDIPAVAAPMRNGVTIPVDAYDRTSKTKLASGSLLTVDNTIDVSTGTVKLKGTFANKDEVLFPNQFVNIQMLVNTVKNALTIPTSGVQRGSQGIYAYVVKADHTVTVKPLTILVTHNDTVAISGLNAGDVVVIDGADKLREGAQVEPVDRSKPQPAPGQPAAEQPGAQKGSNHRHRAQGEASTSASSAQ